MPTRTATGTAVLICLITVCAVTHMAARTVNGADSGPGLVAVEKAVQGRRYLLVFFFNRDDQPTRAMGAVFNKATSRVADRADKVAVMTTDPAERGIVARFGVGRAPMPLVLVLAPNGAVTGSFHTKFTEDQLIGALVGPAEAKTLRSLQQGKLVLVCAQNDKTKFNAEAMRGVGAFKADRRYGGATDIVVIDPARADSRPFLTKLGARFPVDQAVTFFLAPPGSIIGEFRGPVDKNRLTAVLTKAVSGCGTSCKQGSCGVK